MGLTVACESLPGGTLSYCCVGMCVWNACGRTALACFTQGGLTGCCPLGALLPAAVS